MRRALAIAGTAALLSAGLFLSPGSATSHVASWSVHGLTSVSMVSATSAWAVGDQSHDDGASVQTLVEHWDGGSWKQVPSVNPASSNVLYSVDALSDSDIWAVGSVQDSVDDDPQLLTEHWDGHTWSRQAVDPPPGTGFLSASIISADDIWVVGTATAPHNRSHTFTAHWDGDSWTVVPSPDGTGIRNFLSSVHTITPDDVWAVGYSTSSHYFESLIVHWDGATWSHVDSPNEDAPNWFKSVDATSTSNALAVGWSGPSEGLKAHWDGSAWSLSR